MYSEPVAYFITFRTYGTWLHGDERGSVDPHNNGYGESYLPPNPFRQQRDEENLKHPPVTLSAPARASVEDTIREVARFRGWEIRTLNVRTNHVHLVVMFVGPNPTKAMDSLKSWCTRRLREAGIFRREIDVWARHGSTRYLWNEEDVTAAVRYVVERQGEDLPRSETRP